MDMFEPSDFSQCESGQSESLDHGAREETLRLNLTTCVCVCVAMMY